MHVFQVIANVDVEDGAGGRGIASRGRVTTERDGQGRHDAERGDALDGAHLRLIGHAFAGLEGLTDDGAADLVALDEREVGAVAAGMDRLRRAVGIRENDQPAIGAQDLDEDVEASAYHGLAVERTEDAVDQLAQRAPQELVIDGGTARERRDHGAVTGTCRCRSWGSSSRSGCSRWRGCTGPSGRRSPDP